MKQRASDAAAAGTVEASKAGRASPSARLVRQGKRGTRPSANAISVRRRGAGGSPARSHLLTRSEQKPSGQGITWYQRANRRPLAVLLLVPAAGRRRRQRQQSAARTIFQRSLGAASVGFFRSLWRISTPRLDRFRPLLIGSDGECRICTLPRMRHCMRHVAATPRSRAASDFWSPVCATGRLRACQHGDSGKVRRSSALPGFSRGSRGCCRRRSSLAGGGCSGAHGVRPKRWFERRHRDFAGTARYREVYRQAVTRRRFAGPLTTVAPRANDSGFNADALSVDPIVGRYCLGSKLIAYKSIVVVSRLFSSYSTRVCVPPVLYFAALVVGCG